MIKNFKQFINESYYNLDEDYDDSDYGLIKAFFEASN